MVFRPKEKAVSCNVGLGKIAGAQPDVVQKVIDAFDAVRGTGHITVEEIKTGAVLRSENLQSEKLEVNAAFRELIRRAKRVSDFYHVKLTLPEDPTDADFETLGWLESLIDGVEVQANTINMSMTKNREIEEPIYQHMRRETSFMVVAPIDPHPVVFGTQVPTGPIENLIPRAKLLNPLRVIGTLKSAPIGTVFSLSLKLLAPVNFRCVRIEAA